MQDGWPSELERAGYTLIETHISRVFLRGDDVYKTKRKVALGFLDFSTADARRSACHAEVTLNQRLAPDVYRGVVALVRGAGGGLAFAPADACDEAQVIEWAVHMRRLAESERADVLLARGGLGAADIRRIAQRLVCFHAEARCDAETSRYGDVGAIAGNVEENFTQLEAGIAAFVDAHEVAALARSQRAFLRARRAVLEARVRAGCVRDGHGDLRLEHLYRTASGAFLAIDCIEFNDRFRFADVCADLAFLTMDLTVHGRPDLAELLAAHYAEEAGDFGLYTVLDFYQSYRALVRAKVAMLLATDPDVTERARDRGARALRRYFLLALAAQRAPLAPPRVIVTFGSIAGGKSTLAEALRERLCVPLVSTDRTRKQLVGIAPSTAQHDDAFTGAYSAAMSERVYDEVLARAATVLRAGRSVVIDGTFRARADRSRPRALADELGVEVAYLECWCPEPVRAARLAARVEAPSVSDARPAILEAFAARYEDPVELVGPSHRRFDTTRSREQTIEEALAWLSRG